jgi:hypothetical protein
MSTPSPETLGTNPSPHGVPSGPVSGPPTTSVDATGVPLDPSSAQTAGALFDLSSGAYFLIDLGPDPSTRGHVEVVIPHVGLAWSSASATFSRQIASTSTVRYDGPGFLDEHAQLNATFPAATRSSGHSRHVSLRVQATLGQGLNAGHATVWLDGRRYQIASAQPRRDAAQAVRAVLRALRHGRWAALYRLASSSVQTSLRERAFIRSMARRSPTHIVIRVTGPIRYTVSGGISYAQVPATESFCRDASTRQRRITLVLLREPGGWRFLTTRRA